MSFVPTQQSYAKILTARSVNATETEYALAMITKAGVPANKVIVGVSSYGRSFGMADPSCTGPECHFTGTRTHSTASLGRCTKTAGIIADAEIYELIKHGAQSWHDDASDSDMVVYNTDSWAAYMNKQTKSSRVTGYGLYNFGGSVDWAVDLENFSGASDTDSMNITQATNEFMEALDTSGYNMSSFDGNVTDLATRLVRWDGCDSVNKRLIYSGWQQSWKIMNKMYYNAYYDMNFNEAAAVEYLGPPATNARWQDSYKGEFAWPGIYNILRLASILLSAFTSSKTLLDVYINLASIQPGYVTTPFDWRLHVRCDDPALLCSCGGGNTIHAYTVNRDSESGLARINFCPSYFSMSNLDASMKHGNDKSMPESWWANLNTYVPNKG